jgi:Mn2+/Fe2+ NRAMP family transporter
VMLVANDRSVMGSRTNGRALNIVDWATTAAMFAAVLAVVATWTR